MRNRICNNLHSFISRILTICTIISLSTSSAFASTVGQLNSNVSFDFMNIASFKASSNAYFSNVSASPEYLATSSLLGSFINTFGPWYSYKIQSGSSGTPSTYYETKDVNRHLQDISINQWYIDDDIRKLYDRYYTYSDGNASLLNQISTNTTNMYGSQSATNIHLAALRNELKNIDWISANVTFEGWFLPDGTQITDYSHSLNYPIIKARFVAPNIKNTDLFNVSLGIEGWYQIDKASFIKAIYLQHYDSSGATVYPSVLDWHIMRGLTGVSILSRLPNNGRFEIVFETQKPYFITNNGSVSYLDVNSLDYYTVSDNNLLRAILNKDTQSEIVEAINNKQLKTDVNVSINNTITDNDLTLDVDLPNNAINDTSNLLNKLKQLMLTGVATNQLLNALDDVELHAWYSQSNKTVVEAVNNQYTSLYD